MHMRREALSAACKRILVLTESPWPQRIEEAHLSCIHVLSFVIYCVSTSNQSEIKVIMVNTRIHSRGYLKSNTLQHKSEADLLTLHLQVLPHAGPASSGAHASNLVIQPQECGVLLDQVGRVPRVLDRLG